MIDYICENYYFKLLIKLIVLQYTCKLIMFIYKSCFRKRLNLTQRYGENTWVVVTGSTDGIGRGICEEFAKEGFNIILVGRNIEKLEKVAKEIEKEFNKNIKTFCVQFDFDKKTNLEDYKLVFATLQEKFDISILVNNVGVGEVGKFAMASEEYINRVINVNIIPQTFLTKIFCEKMSKRSHRSAIIDISSSSRRDPQPGKAIYAAAKTYNFYLSRALADEFESQNIDFSVCTPGFVSTPMLKNALQSQKMKEIKSFTLRPNEVAQKILDGLGQDKENFGHWNHNIQTFIYKNFPFTRKILHKIFK